MDEGVDQDARYLFWSPNSNFLVDIDATDLMIDVK